MASVASWLPFARASAIGWVPIAKSRLPAAINFGRRVAGSTALVPSSSSFQQQDRARRRSTLKDVTSTSSSTAAKAAIRGQSGESALELDDGLAGDISSDTVGGDHGVVDDDVGDDDLDCHGDALLGRSMSAASGGPITEDRVCFNVSGQRFETWPQTLQKYPDTLLGSDEKDYFFDISTNEVRLLVRVARQEARKLSN